jgi:branched-chain amino acid aminotransferase
VGRARQGDGTGGECRNDTGRGSVVALVYLNGALLDGGVATISVHDHGLVVGDGVFETALVLGGRPFALARHLDRLERSAAGLGLVLPDREELAAAVVQVAASLPSPRARLRCTVTSGPGPLGSARGGGPPTVVVAVDEDDPAPPTVPVARVPWTRNEHGPLAGLKTISYAGNARALAHAAARGASEAIFANTAGQLCEGTGSNVFVVLDGTLVTPTLASGCLDGVTRALVLEHFGGLERDVPVEALEAASEAFLTSTLRGVQAIVAVDGRPVAGPGPVTSAAAAAYEALLLAGLPEDAA